MAAIAIAGLPAAWNVVARNEYRHHTIEKAVGDKKRGAYLLAAAIFVVSFGRDAAFMSAVEHNPADVLPVVREGVFGSAERTLAVLRVLGATLMSAGTALVVSSFARLGITGTYLGDYFGILMPARVTAFPFSHFENPMYLGATMNFLGAALSQNSGVGVLLTGWVAMVYHVSTTYFENPFTAMIYAKDAEAKKDSAAAPSPAA